MATKRQFLYFLHRNKACYPAYMWALEQKTARDIVEKCSHPEWLSWLAYTLKGKVLASLAKSSSYLSNLNDRRWTWAISEAQYSNEHLAFWRSICNWERVSKELDRHHAQQMKAKRKGKK